MYREFTFRLKSVPNILNKKIKNLKLKTVMENDKNRSHLCDFGICCLSSSLICR